MVTGHYRAGQDGYWTLQGGTGRQLKKTIAKTVTAQWSRKVIGQSGTTRESGEGGTGQCETGK
jgi:hypothetical protein